jgi:hypothetical protein
VTEREEIRKAAFDFARRLGDHDFRTYLNNRGCRCVQDVVVTLDTDTVMDVMSRVLTRTKPPAMIAISRPTTTWGFVFLAVSPAPVELSRTAGPCDPLAPSASIGMLYDNMSTAGKELDPNSWFTVHRLPELSNC